MNLVVTNVAGPPVPLYLVGAPLRELFPMMPVMGNLTLVAAVLSYAGQLNFTVTADRDACPDVKVFAEGVRSVLGDLAVQELTTRLERVPQVTGAVNAYTSPDPMLRARDEHASLIVVSVRNSGDMMGQAMTVDTMRAEARAAVPGAQVLVGGDVAVMRDSMIAVQKDLLGGTLIALPVVLIALFSSSAAGARRCCRSSPRWAPSPLP